MVLGRIPLCICLLLLCLYLLFGVRCDVMNSCALNLNGTLGYARIRLSCEGLIVSYQRCVVSALPFGARAAFGVSGADGGLG